MFIEMFIHLKLLLSGPASVSNFTFPIALTKAPQFGSSA